MGFEYLTNVPLAQARKEYLERLVSGGFGSKTETIPVFESCGRVTAKAVYAHICAPHYAASAMDGVAVSAKETFGATETTPVTLKPDQFLVLDTGDPIPEDKDAVIMVEDIVKNGDGSITIHAAAAPWQHIRQIGEDVQHLDDCLGQVDIKGGHTDVGTAADGQRCTQHGHVAHAGQHDFFRPGRVRDEGDVTANDRHRGNEDICDQQDLADEQNHLVGKVVRRSDLIQSGKDFRHRNSSI
mgnify:FL=1